MAASFDRLARIYRFLEHLAFGRTLERARGAHLSALRTCTRVLLVGDGDGRCLEAVLRAAPDALVTSVDTSPEMLQLARRRAARAGATTRVTFVCDDIRTMRLPAAQYDAVLTMFVLDCFTPTDASAVVHRLATTATPGALWLFVDFAVPAHGWRSRHARLQVGLLYAFFRWATRLEASHLPASEALISAAGFEAAGVQEHRAGSIRSVRFTRTGEGDPPVRLRGDAS